MDDAVTTVADLARHLTAIEAFIGAEAARSATSVAGRTSRFWSDLFQSRPNFPDLCAFLGFRRDGFGYGMADERQGGVDHERQHHARNAEIFRWSVDPALIGVVDEPTLGAPYVFEAHDVCRSAAFWVNAATAHRVSQFVAAYGPRKRRLRVLEIGAGWGAGAYQIHHLLPVESYTIVDLPENLLLSMAYLGATLGREPFLIQCEGGRIDDVPGRTLAGLLPGALPRLGMRYDLILNSFSLQEMDRDTVEAYLSWIEGALADDGLFVSFNAHGKAGIRRPSEYRYERFHLHHLGMFRRFPSGFENTIPSEVVVSRRRAPSCEGQAIETLCLLHQFGLDRDLDDLTRATVERTLSSEQQSILAALHGFFSPDSALREAALDQPCLAAVPGIAAYLDGQHRMVQGDVEAAQTRTAQSLERGLDGFAAVRATVTLAILSGQRQIAPRPDLLDAATAYPDVARMLDQGDLDTLIRRFHTIMAP